MYRYMCAYVKTKNSNCNFNRSSMLLFFSLLNGSWIAEDSNGWLSGCGRAVGGALHQVWGRYHDESLSLLATLVMSAFWDTSLFSGVALLKDFFFSFLISIRFWQFNNGYVLNLLKHWSGAEPVPVVFWNVFLSFDCHLKGI